MQENVVYDFSLFEPKEDKEEERRQQEEELRAAQAAAAQKEAEKPKTRAASVLRPAVAIKWTALALAVALALSAVMLCNVKLTKLNDQISKAQTQLTAAQGEEVRLNMQLESRSTLSAVEAYAEQKLGLAKSTDSQVTYIHLDDTDKVEVTPQKENIFTHLVNFILEYL
jgi:cell division protein FtsL